MPHKPPRPCLYPGCVHTTLSRQGYCQAHAHHYQPPQYSRTPDTRPSASARGYNSAWQSIRVEVLRTHGIPKELWKHYDVHHEPPYNPAVEPNHRAYTLTPLLREEHSRVTNRSRGRGVKSLGVLTGDRKGSRNFHTIKMEKNANGR